MRGGGVGVGVRVAVAVCLLATSVGVAMAAGGGAGSKAVSVGGNTTNSTCPPAKPPGIRVVSVRWHEVGVYFTITTFVIIAGFAKLVFHHLHWLSNKVPESCVLVMLGMALGLIVYFTTKNQPSPANQCDHVVPLPHFTSDMFFFILLPPIVLESAYSLHDRAFFDNLGTVLVFALIGTLFNIATIGPTMYGLNLAGAMGSINFTFTEGLVFSSLISAVDPVAVLAIFQELGVNKDLYFLVFGESLLNDGMTVVVYNTVTSFMAMEEVTGWQYVLAVVAFGVVVFGGLLIGVIFGCITALVTKSTTDVRVVEPLALLGLSYLSYLTAELFHFSGIISLIVCGLIQAHYAFQNISQKSYTTVKYFTKMASATSETVIFMFLGMVLVSDDHLWHTGFVLWSVFLCFLYRFIGVFFLTGIMNNYRIKKVGLEEQFIAAYGGLRGAVAFSLVNMLDESLPPRRIFVTATLAVILCTIFIQGTTVKPLVGLLQIRKHSSGKKNLSEEINDTTMDHIMAGVEEILGQHGDFYLRELIIHYNDRYLRKWFLRSTCESKLTRLFEKIAISEHYAHLYGPVAMIEDHVKPFCPPITSTVTQTVSYSASQKEEMVTHPEFPTVKDTYEKVEDVIAESPEGVQMRKKYSIIPIRQSRVSSEVTRTPSSAHQDASILRKAFRSNPYNKLHYKYNPNLVGEEDQELEEHLNRRHMNARRLTHFASTTRRPSSICPTPPSRLRTTSEGGGALPDGVAELVQRHNMRRQSMMQMRSQGARRPLQGCFSSPNPGSWSPASPSILRALQETTEPDQTSPPKDTASTSSMSPSSTDDHPTSPWKWSEGAARSRDPQAGQAEEEVPLVNVSRAGKDPANSKDTEDKQV
ncbi:sodium/hydrogen exchanger 2-like isoform X2 [Portunus trituberculatus]|uniref:sodium/hydrogen exchanger 2-like isoform X2 n=1 Tax=Portunus trituberculatus TaxID=210409 RepID=UPI001E1CFA5F|nr:sodium/hydrogen exchanger 2-like isoform X2 [Portunus trituberculatus]